MPELEQFVQEFKPYRLNRFFQSFHFKVPPNQREYSWSREHWEELWRDILELIEERETPNNNSYYTHHFFGPMFFLNNAAESSITNQIRILDGQQRIVSINLILNIIYDLLLRKQNTESRMQEGDILLTGEINSLLFEGTNLRLILGKFNNDSFKKLMTYKRGTDELPSPVDKIKELKKQLKEQGNIRGSNTQILKCYEFFLEQIVDRLCELNNRSHERPINTLLVDFLIQTDKFNDFIYNLYQSIAQGLFVLIVQVPNFEIGYEMFETLNQRGEKLLVMDLFKNLIFEKFEGPLGVEALEEIWEALVDTVGDDLGDFLRYFWLSNYEFIRQKEFFRKIRIKINEQNLEQFKNFIEKMIKEAKLYRALRNSTDGAWSNHRDVSLIIEDLDILGFRQGIPFLISAYIKEGNTPSHYFKELLKTYLNFCFRSFTVLRSSPSTYEEDYSKWAIKLRNEQNFRVTELIQEIKSITPNDSKIKENFNGLEVNPTVGRYIITKINDFLSSTSLMNARANYPTLEHVIPKTPEDWWKNKLKEYRMEHEDFVNRLGNMTILSTQENSELGNLPYPEKREKYLDMNLPINNETFKDFIEFNAETIEKREKIMAEHAIKIW